MDGSQPSSSRCVSIADAPRWSATVRRRIRADLLALVLGTACQFVIVDMLRCLRMLTPVRMDLFGGDHHVSKIVSIVISHDRSGTRGALAKTWLPTDQSNELTGVVDGVTVAVVVEVHEDVSALLGPFRDPLGPPLQVVG
jgi:hypothetical protein